MRNARVESVALEGQEKERVEVVRDGIDIVDLADRLEKNLVVQTSFAFQNF